MNKYFAILTLILLLSSKAGLTADIQISNSILSELVNTADNISFQVKRDQPYDETKDPALRRGTENWEEEQSSFFVIPAVIIGIIGLLIFFTRNKND